jgi:2-polyprenyl-3-methyl-5-hydroxy-6-metoxy-1,4-benzoquinol methylase
MLSNLSNLRGKQIQRSAIDIVKTNTKEAFELFYTQRDFIDKCYLAPGRLESYDLVAKYCRGILSTRDPSNTVHVIDLGCGTGHMLKALRDELQAVPHLELLGIDFAKTAIRKARRVVPEANFMIGDIYDNRQPSESFNLVLCVEVLEHLRDPERAILEMVRLCKTDDGHIVVTVPNGEMDSWEGHINFWTLSQFTDMASKYAHIEVRLLKDGTIILGHLMKRQD